MSPSGSKGPAPQRPAGRACWSSTFPEPSSPGELPGLVAPLPTWRITPAAITPHADILTRRADLDAFELAARSLFSEIEATAKSTEVLHVFPALPVAAAVMLGRVRDPQVHPRLLIYDRTAGGYRPVLEVT
jgi:hypothetical protein